MANEDDVDTLFQEFVETGFLTPEPGNEGYFSISISGLLFIDAMLQVYGLTGLAARLARLAAKGELDDCRASLDATKKKLH